jgi:hypothetical protein
MRDRVSPELHGRGGRDPARPYCTAAGLWAAMGASAGRSELLEEEDE